jgi:hypothetical protein
VRHLILEACRRGRKASTFAAIYRQNPPRSLSCSGKHRGRDISSDVINVLYQFAQFLFSIKPNILQGNKYKAQVLNEIPTHSQNSRVRPLNNAGMFYWAKFNTNKAEMLTFGQTTITWPHMLSLKIRESITLINVSLIQEIEWTDRPTIHCISCFFCRELWSDVQDDDRNLNFQGISLLHRNVQVASQMCHGMLTS